MHLQGGRSAHQLNNNDNLFLSGNDNKMSRKERSREERESFLYGLLGISAAA
jgi:hypothetical protein